jgi:hypothetical protein
MQRLGIAPHALFKLGMKEFKGIKDVDTHGRAYRYHVVSVS